MTAVLNMVAIFANDECLKLQLEDQDWTTPSIDTPELVLAATALPGTNAVKVGCTCIQYSHSVNMYQVFL